MAVEHLKSTPITNADSTPRTLNSARVTAMMLKEAVGTVTASAAASVGSTYRFCRVPSNARDPRLHAAASLKDRSPPFQPL